MFSEVSVHGLASHGPIVELENQESRLPCTAEKQKTEEGPGPTLQRSHNNSRRATELLTRPLASEPLRDTDPDDIIKNSQ